MYCWGTIGAEAETMTAILDRVRSLAGWVLGASENDSDPLVADEELDVISPDEGRAILDRVAQRHLGMSGDEFRQRWTAGEFAGSRDPGVTRVAMLLPLGR